MNVPEEKRDHVDSTNHENDVKTKNPTNVMLRKIWKISFIASIVVIVMAIVGICLVQTEVFRDVERSCSMQYADESTTKIVSDNRTQFVDVTLGGFANLHCNAPQEQWDRETCVIWKRSNNSIPRVEGVQQVGLTLHFDVVKATDSGLYYCVLCSNKQCTEGVRTDFELHVDERARAPKDLYLDGPRNTRVRVGGTAYFFCYYNEKAPDSPQLRWWRVLANTGKIEEMISTDRSGTNQSLFVRNVQKEDSGLYTCQAKTNVGVQAITAVLTIDDGWIQTKRATTITLFIIASLAFALIVIFASIKRWSATNGKALTMKLSTLYKNLE